MSERLASIIGATAWLSICSKLFPEGGPSPETKAETQKPSSFSTKPSSLSPATRLPRPVYHPQSLLTTWSSPSPSPPPEISFCDLSLGHSNRHPVVIPAPALDCHSLFPEGFAMVNLVCQLAWPRCAQTQHYFCMCLFHMRLEFKSVTR